MNTHKGERGQALILIVFAIIGLVGMTALTVDSGIAYSDHRSAQNASDTAALAAARAKVRNEVWKSAALSIASANGYADSDAGPSSSSTSVNVEVYGCNEAGASCGSPYAGNASYLQVIIISTIKTSFGSVLGVQNVTNKVSSIAQAAAGTQEVMYGSSAVVGLKQNNSCSGNDKPAIYFSGNTQLQTWGGGVFSNSSSNCGLKGQGSANVQTHECANCSSGFNMVAGAYEVNGSPTLDSHGEGFHYNLPQQPYPPPNLPNPSCANSASWSGSNMSPGSYSGTFPPNGVRTLQPGIYCISGDFNLNAGNSLTGNGVVIVLLDGEINWNGNSTIKLKAPTTGPYSGLLFYAPPTNTNLMTMRGSSDTEFTGTMLMPGADIFMNGDYQWQKTNSQIIGYTVEMSGSSQIQMVINPNEQYQPSTPPTVALAR